MYGLIHTVIMPPNVPPGRCNRAIVKEQPGAFTIWPGRIMQLLIGLGSFRLQGRYKITILAGSQYMIVHAGITDIPM